MIIIREIGHNVSLNFFVVSHKMLAPRVEWLEILDLSYLNLACKISSFLAWLERHLVLSCYLENYSLFLLKIVGCALFRNSVSKYLFIAKRWLSCRLGLEAGMLNIRS